MLHSRNGGLNGHVVKKFRGRSFIDKVDQFAASEFFYENGRLIDSAILFLKSDADPVLRQKLQNYVVQNEAKMLPEEMSDEEVMLHFQSRYVTQDSIKAAIDARIAYLDEAARREADRKAFIDKLNSIDAE